MFNPVRAEEMAFALSVFVSAANGQVHASGAPDVLRALRERRECQRFLSFLAPAGEEGRSLREAAARADSLLLRAVLAVWAHDREDKARLSLVARVLAFYTLTERTGGAVVERWYDNDPESPETVLLHPAVVEAIATVPLSARGRLSVEDFSRAVEAAAETRSECAEAAALEQRAEQGEIVWPEPAITFGPELRPGVHPR